MPNAREINHGGTLKEFEDIGIAKIAGFLRTFETKDKFRR